jgi:hypothetical protein
MSTNIQNNAQLPTIIAALEASIASYGDNEVIFAMIAAGWRLVPQLEQDTVAESTYHGMAFYRTLDDATEVIIANRGSSTFHDFAVSDALLAFNIVPDSDTDALDYCNAVVAWVRGSVAGGNTLQVIETGHSLGGHEVDFVEASLPANAPPTVAVTFDAPGQSTTTAASAGVVNALNISLRNELVHSAGAILNAGYLGSSITIGRGINPAVAALTSSAVLPGGLGLLAGFVAGFIYNHGTGRLTNYFAQSNHAHAEGVGPWRVMRSQAGYRFRAEPRRLVDR